MGRTVSNALGYAPEDDEFDPIIDDFAPKERKYVHFDLPLDEAARDNFSFTPAELASHSFWPLLGFVSLERRAKKDTHGKLVITEKERPIKFGSHLDAAIYEWYAKSLSVSYEKFLSRGQFSKSVLAYRKSMGDNIDQAKSLFDEIKNRNNCISIAIDISGFFDHINHDNLKLCLGRVLGFPVLSPSDFKIFTRMTKFEWVESDLLRARLGRLYGKSGRICTAYEFRKYVRETKPSLINVNPNKYGVPQGTPLSGLYANISMVYFDEFMHNFVSSFGGSYRRYSDDIAVVVPIGVDIDAVMDMMKQRLGLIGLEISEKKTEISTFKKERCRLIADKPFQYLGFTYDGEKVLIRNSSLNRYYSKMHSGIRAKVRAAKEQNIERDVLFLRQLYQRYTHFGKSKNFPRYAYRAAKRFGSDDIRRQMTRHISIFKRALKYYLDRAY